MSTHFQVRIAGEESAYAAQAAKAALDRLEVLEGLLSRFRETSEVSQIAQLQAGERLRVSQPMFACLRVAQDMENVSRGAFSITARLDQTPLLSPRWSLDLSSQEFCCELAPVLIDLGAIGKGFALDLMAEELQEWGCPAFLLNAGGSSILAGDPPPDTLGWDCGLSDDQETRRYWLTQGSLSGSGTAVKGLHIIDPRTGRPAERRNRAWLFAPTAAVSDALSTACMVLSDSEISEIMQGQKEWLALVKNEKGWCRYGERVQPSVVPD